LVLATRKVSHSVWVLAALLILASLFLPASLFLKPSGPLWEPFSSQQAMMLLLILSMALVIVALLLYSGLNLYKEWQDAGAVEDGSSQAQRKQAGRAAAVVLVLSALLLAKALHNFYWFMVWDATGDSLGYFWLAVPVPAVLLSGVVLSIVLPGRTKLAGFLYSLLVLALVIGVSACAQRVDLRQLTEERAERVTQAIETHYAREGRYPHDLRQLTPWYVLSLPGPVIIYGQDWCYDGGEDYYRLGYVYRENWSDPRLTGRIYKTKGEAPDLPGICAKEIAALEKRDQLSRERR
jgi:membrane protein implicated in regulation of membrane protease activity